VAGTDRESRRREKGKGDRWGERRRGTEADPLAGAEREQGRATDQKKFAKTAVSTRRARGAKRTWTQVSFRTAGGKRPRREGGGQGGKKGRREKKGTSSSEKPKMRGRGCRRGIRIYKNSSSKKKGD